jgi:hypothetical protein
VPADEVVVTKALITGIKTSNSTVRQHAHRAAAQHSSAGRCDTTYTARSVPAWHDQGSLFSQLNSPAGQLATAGHLLSSLLLLHQLDATLRLHVQTADVWHAVAGLC